jgi:hypothetical protein
MRSLQILTNKYLTEKQQLEYKLETEINKTYSDVDVIDDLLERISIIKQKDEYLTNLLIQISNANDKSIPTTK